MRIAVCIASRARPMAMLGVIMSLWRLRSGKHDLVFSVAVDDDDTATLDAQVTPDPGLAVNLWPAPRETTLGAINNRALAKVKGEADIATFLSDRAFCLTPDWDDVIARSVAQRPNRLLWWSCPKDPGCLLPIMPRAWLDACEWRWSPAIFPFWFDDTWMQQIDLLIHGMPSLKTTAAYAGVRGSTMRGRDFAFWIDVFEKTLPMRIEQARIIAKRLGVTMIERPDVLDYIAKLQAMQAGRAAEFENTFGDKTEPGPEYLAAKAAAEHLINGAIPHESVAA